MKFNFYFNFYTSTFDFELRYSLLAIQSDIRYWVFVSVVLKELRESNVAFKMADGLKLAKDQQELAALLKEVNELIAIFVTSVETARRNDEKTRIAKSK